MSTGPNQQNYTEGRAKPVIFLDRASFGQVGKTDIIFRNQQVAGSSPVGGSMSLGLA